MDQLLRLLRAKCAYCSHLKLHPAEVNRFSCKLKLIRYGLLKEAEDLEEIQLKSKTIKTAGGGGSDEEPESGESEEEDADSLIKRRNDFVKRSIKNAGGRKRRSLEVEKVEAVSEERRAVIKEFLGVVTKGRVCGTCKG